MRKLIQGTALLAVIVLVVACEEMTAPPTAHEHEHELVCAAPMAASPGSQTSTTGLRITRSDPYYLVWEWNATPSATYYQADLEEYNYPGRWADFYGSPYTLTTPRIGINPGTNPCDPPIRLRVRSCNDDAFPACSPWSGWSASTIDGGGGLRMR